MLDGDLAIMNKARPEHDRAEVTEVIGDVRGKVAILSDDMIVTGGTLIAGAAALREAGATEVYACATHGLFSGDAFEKIADERLGARDRDRHGRRSTRSTARRTSTCCRSRGSSRRRS